MSRCYIDEAGICLEEDVVPGNAGVAQRSVGVDGGYVLGFKIVVQGLRAITFRSASLGV